jgi:ribonuclease P/MRP protein subunit RPP40
VGVTAVFEKSQNVKFSSDTNNVMVNYFRNNPNFVVMNISPTNDSWTKSSNLNTYNKQQEISGKLGNWLHNFLYNRKQYIIANGVKSSQSEVTSGVPQGTVLGPILFLILNNDINKDVLSDVSLFADDTRIVKPVKDFDDVEDLQADLETLYLWQDQNNMKCNGNKFELLRYGRDEDLKFSTNYLTPGAEEIIDNNECLRDLGVMMSDDAKFTEHVYHVCSKVCQKCGWILRTFNCRKTFFLKFMWKTLVQGHIDYCLQLYFPSQSKELELLEDLQKIYTKKIPEVRHMDYFFTLSRGPAYRLPMPLFYFSVQVIETSI